MESRRRSLAKALSWRVIALAVTTGLGYALTSSATFAVSIGVADSLIKIVAYYMHERAWMNVHYGRRAQSALPGGTARVEVIATVHAADERDDANVATRSAVMRRAC